METYKSKYDKAVRLLKLALDQNDEKDELQLEIQKYLIENGELTPPKTIKELTKKEFKEKCDFHVYSNGRKENKRNTIFYDWKHGEIDGKFFVGFKFMISAKIVNCGKPELFDEFYNWVTGKTQQPPWYVEYKYAETDLQRFKIPLSM